MVRGPACATCWALVIWPKLPVMFMFGSPQLSDVEQIGELRLVPKTEALVKWNVLPVDIEKVAVPGPSRIPTPQLPKRPMGSAVPAASTGWAGTL